MFYCKWVWESIANVLMGFGVCETSIIHYFIKNTWAFKKLFYSKFKSKFAVKNISSAVVQQILNIHRNQRIQQIQRICSTKHFDNPESLTKKAFHEMNLARNGIFGYRTKSEWLFVRMLDWIIGGRKLMKMDSKSIIHLNALNLYFQLDSIIFLKIQIIFINISFISIFSLQSETSIRTNYSESIWKQLHVVWI